MGGATTCLGRAFKKGKTKEKSRKQVHEKMKLREESTSTRIETTAARKLSKV